MATGKETAKPQENLTNCSVTGSSPQFTIITTANFAIGRGIFLWIRVECGYVQCDPIQAREFQEREVIHQWEEIPSDATPMEAELIQPGIWRCTTATYVLVTGIAPVTTFDEYVATLPKWEQELLQHTTLATDAYAIGVALEHGFRAVSDGSAWFQTQGSFGWILSSDTGERLAIGMGPASGNKPNSYRSEG